MEHGTFQKEGRKESMRKSELKRVWALCSQAGNKASVVGA